MTAPADSEQRLIRVFVSSTFRDMQDERDELVLRIFPQLRRLCEQRGVTWGDVDLRWGITEQQARRGEELPHLSGRHAALPATLHRPAERASWRGAG